MSFLKEEEQFYQKQDLRSLRKEDNKNWKKSKRRTSGKDWQRKQREKEAEEWTKRPIVNDSTKKHVESLEEKDLVNTESKKICLEAPLLFQSFTEVLQANNVRISYSQKDLGWYDWNKKKYVVNYILTLRSKGQKNLKVEMTFHSQEDIDRFEKIVMIDDPKTTSKDKRYLFRFHIKDEIKCTYLVMWITTKKPSVGFQFIHREIGDEFHTQLALDRYLIPEMVLSNMDSYEKLDDRHNQYQGKNRKHMPKAEYTKGGFSYSTISQAWTSAEQPYDYVQLFLCEFARASQ